MPPAALLVCSVLSTRWPVSADWIAMRAVSRSRISPIMMMSGSWRTIERSAWAKSSPICGLAWIWLMPSIWYSTGSSTVMILTSAVLSLLSAVYSVVVLPEPVGPVTSRMPCGCCSTCSNCGRNSSVKPRLWKSSTTVSRSSRRITTDSPCAVGTVLDAQVEFLALHAQHDAAVLRQAALGDVELGHDLDAADHRGGQVDRRALAFGEHAVDAVAHLQAVLERLDVDVGRAQLDRALDHQVHQPDHRRFRGEVAQVLDVVEVAALAFRGLDDRAHRAAALAVPALDQVVDLRTQRHQRAHLALHRQAQCVERVRVLRVGQQHVDRGLAFADGADVELLHELGGERHALGRQLRHVLDADQRQVEHFGDGLGVVALRHQAQPREQRQQAAAGFLLQPARAAEIGVLEPALGQQRRDDALVDAGLDPCVVDDCVHAALPV